MERDYVEFLASRETTRYDAKAIKLVPILANDFLLANLYLTDRWTFIKPGLFTIWQGERLGVANGLTKSYDLAKFQSAGL